MLAVLDGVASVIGFGRARVHSRETARVLRELKRDETDALRGDWQRVGRDLAQATEKLTREAAR